jgi:hypothetical protein
MVLNERSQFHQPFGSNCKPERQRAMTPYEQQQFHTLKKRVLELEAEVKRLNTPTDFTGFTGTKELLGFEGIMPDRNKAFNEYGDAIMDIIKPRNKKNAIISEQLEEMLGISGTIVRSVVGSWRDRGAWICSSGNGYWWGTRKEAEVTLESLMQRARVIFLRARNMGKSLAKPAVQESLF